MTWIETEKNIKLELKTKDFLSAYHVVSALVAPAEEMNHHPDIAFGWGYVHITLTTHDAGGITDKDRRLAERIDQALRPFGLG